MSRQSAPDPLADLREPEAPPGIVATQEPAFPSPGSDLPTEGEVEPTAEPVHDTEWHQVAASLVVERWHRDSVARAQMHGGGTCGCRYAASMALVALYGPPVLPEVDDEVEDPA